MIDMDVAGIPATNAAFDELGAQWTGMAGWTVASNVEYSIYVEYGTSKMPADRSLRNAIRQTLNNLDRIAARSDGADELGRNVAESIADAYRGSVPVDTGTLRRSIVVRKESS